MAAREILLLGNPELLEESESVRDSERSLALEIGNDLHDTMASFRGELGWGRAISAPQIGVRKRVIAVNVDRPRLIINPRISDPSEEMMEIWDDCMSFPELLVKVRRHVSFTMSYTDEGWETRTERIEGLMSELLQHEIDHLDGILAVSRAIDGASFALQSERGRIRDGNFANAVNTL